ncbi:MAG TPA: Ig-like domain-containing protein, partial [Edaphobacter sp.]|nr:Ig-like domain-containing protein [Edaphobacter sp.]
GSVAAATPLTVSALPPPTTPTLVSLSISPLNPSVVVGGTQQFAATAFYSDSSKTDVTSSATWSSSNTAVATISATGLASAVAQGNTTIGATYEGQSASTTFISPASCLSFFPVDVFLTMNGASPGTAVTLDNLAASTEIAANYSGWTTGSAAQTFGASLVPLPAGISVNGGSSHNCGFATQSLVHNAAVSFSTSEMDFPQNATNVTTSGWVVNLPPNQGTSGGYYDMVLNLGAITPYTAVLQLQSGTNNPACTDWCLEIEASGGTTIHSMGNTSVTPGSTIFFSMNTNWTTTGACMNQPVTNASWTSSTATITVGKNIINTGSTVTVSGMTPSGYNGTYQVISATGTTISYALNTNPGTYSSGGTAVLPAPCTQANVYSTSGTAFTQVGSTMAVSMGGKDVLGSIRLGNGENGAFAGTYDFQNIMVDYTNHIWPNLPH